MMFQNWIFLPFFMVAYAVYLAVKRTRLKNLWILIASYVFYGWWNPLFLLLIGYATVFDYIMAALMEAGRRKKLWLTLAVVNNLALLSFFKYGYFVVENINLLLERMGSSYALEMSGILLPVGISFYVFKSIGYIVDYYRGNIEREKSFVRHAVFVSFFPLLIAGPIERAGNLLPQIRNTPKLTPGDIADGFSLFIVGLFKKVALADCLALYVDKVYNAPTEYQSAALILATFAFTWQIYFDVSGYSDMARGVARLMGFRIMLNFNHPYLAVSIGDFWHRWHISLSTWFRDYLYIPLGGNRKGSFNTYRNLFLTFVISGLWHGAAWTFVIWGALHGLGMVLTRTIERSTVYKEKMPKLLKQILVFIFVSFAWIFFRADSWDTASLIITRIFTSGWTNPEFPLWFIDGEPIRSVGWTNPQFPLLFVAMIFSVWLYQFAYESPAQRFLNLAPVRIGAVIMMIFYLTVCVGSTGQAFIYNQF
ncbi:MAG: MBOAT family protein [Sedimentisphaerales bacterium]|nr:MBOAT family protein [Sedimentisphaerales bacterium]